MIAKHQNKTLYQKRTVCVTFPNTRLRYSSYKTLIIKYKAFWHSIVIRVYNCFFT